jgi:hypothetical protein
VCLRRNPKNLYNPARRGTVVPAAPPPVTEEKNTAAPTLSIAEKKKAFADAGWLTFSSGKPKTFSQIHKVIKKEFLPAKDIKPFFAWLKTSPKVDVPGGTKASASLYLESSETPQEFEDKLNELYYKWAEAEGADYLLDNTTGADLTEEPAILTAKDPFDAGAVGRRRRA